MGKSFRSLLLSFTFGSFFLGMTYPEIPAAILGIVERILEPMETEPAPAPLPQPWQYEPQLPPSTPDPQEPQARAVKLFWA